jgi:hypothetical protein
MSADHLPTKGEIMATAERTSEQGATFDATLIQGFILNALSDDAVIDRVNDLLFEHVVEGRYHPSVIAESLRPIIDEILQTATFEDWSAVAGQLAADARETLGDTADAAGSPR